MRIVFQHVLICAAGTLRHSSSTVFAEIPIRILPQRFAVVKGSLCFIRCAFVPFIKTLQVAIRYLLGVRIGIEDARLQLLRRVPRDGVQLYFRLVHNFYYFLTFRARKYNFGARPVCVAHRVFVRAHRLYSTARRAESVTVRKILRFAPTD